MTKKVKKTADSAEMERDNYLTGICQKVFEFIITTLNEEGAKCDLKFKEAMQIMAVVHYYFLKDIADQHSTDVVDLISEAMSRMAMIDVLTCWGEEGLNEILQGLNNKKQ